MNAYPTLVDLSNDNRHFLGDKDVCLIGRSADANVCLADAECSRFHARVVRESGRWFVESLAPRNPTLCDGRVIQSRVPIRHGAVLEFGSSRFRFEEHSEEMDRDADINDGRAKLANVSEAESATSAGTPTKSTRRSRAHVLLTAPVALPDGMAVSIGRSAEHCAITLSHPTISERHLRVTRRGTTLTVKDLSSLLGTFVNSHRLCGEAIARPGDRLDVGPYTLLFDGQSLIPASRQNNVELKAIGLRHTVASRENTAGLTLLHDVSLAIRPGEFVTLIGPSGSGKSTLLSILSGRQRPSEGRVLLNDRDFHSDFEALKEDAAVVPQRDLLHETLTVEQSLRFTARLRLSTDTDEVSLQARINDVLETVQLREHRHKQIRLLSGGQIKRVSLAQEIIAQPSLLFLDEVTSGLDEETDRDMMKLFRQLADTGKTIVCVTHNLGHVEECCHLVVILAPGGSLAFVGTPIEAKEYFGVQQLGEIYERLTAKLPLTSSHINSSHIEMNWTQRYLSSPLARRYLQGRMPALTTGTAGTATESLPEGIEALGAAARRVSWSLATFDVSRFTNQFSVLWQRYLTLFVNDRQAVCMTAMQCVLIAVLLVGVFPDFEAATSPVERAQQAVKVLFVLGLSCLWFGCNNASKELVRERALIARERNVNLQLAAYLAAKLVLLSGISVLQGTVLFAVTDYFLNLPGGWLSTWLVLSATAIAGVTLGLLISAISDTSEGAVTTVPIVLVPQIILSGFLTPLVGWWETLGQGAITHYWGYRALAAGLPENLAQVVGSHDWSWTTAMCGIGVQAALCLLATFACQSITSERIAWKWLIRLFSLRSSGVAQPCVNIPC